MKKGIQNILEFLSNPKKLAIFNGILIAIIIALNSYMQAFCIPTTWAIIVLTICFANTIVYPLIENSKWAPYSSFINGISLFVFIYCVIFLGEINFIGLIFIFAALVIYIPHFFVIQIIWKNLIKPKIKSSRHYFLAAIVLCIGIVIYVGIAYKQAIYQVEEFKKSGYTKLEKNFMTEKILGMHFIYHTRFCYYDGWRPPKHEPILVIGMWLNGRTDPLNVDLKTRLELYKKFFPENKYKFNCSCAFSDRKYYHNDELWK